MLDVLLRRVKEKKQNSSDILVKSLLAKKYYLIYSAPKSEPTEENIITKSNQIKFYMRQLYFGSAVRTQIMILRLNNCLLILAQMVQLKIKSTNPMPAVSIL